MNPLCVQGRVQSSVAVLQRFIFRALVGAVAAAAAPTLKVKRLGRELKSHICDPDTHILPRTLPWDLEVGRQQTRSRTPVEFSSKGLTLSSSIRDSFAKRTKGTCFSGCPTDAKGQSLTTEHTTILHWQLHCGEQGTKG